MRLIVGLGNPGRKYKGHRHNVGFMTAEAIAVKYGVNLKKCKRTHSLRGEFVLNNEKIMLATPQTFMNNSGQSLSQLVNYYKIKPQDLWVIYDDVDLPLGKIGIRNKGSAGGHRGMQSIIDYLNNENFNRIRIGIGSNWEKGLPAEKYVLQNFTAQERKRIDKTISEIVNNLSEIIKKKGA
jgi:PTH1 family peptidyl-tRNA hydrolase